MKILTVVKPSGANFIRHYLPYFPDGSRTAYTAQDAINSIPNFDIVLFEWANDLTAQIINSEKFRELQSKHQFKPVVRIHDHEVTKVFANERRIDRIAWNRVDSVWFINPLIRQQFHELKGREIRSFFLPNAVDPALFPEYISHEKRVGVVSLYFRQRKRLDRVAQIARLLPDWLFHIRVEIPTPDHAEYWCEYQKFKRLSAGLENIQIETRSVGLTERGRYEPADLVQWYRDKAVILSTSDHEGFHYAVAEGALSGCMPVVWNWPSSEAFWAPYLVESVEQAAERIASYRPSPEWRRYVLDNFCPEKLVRELLEKIE